ncbi:hypothetical protein Sru01_34450 [Sphaerisporangium rufum]|uniref:Pycsar effector protein domain-containing protein n=1 Tax=Sphaerisporangium rufum TaxID=1381558 RepID=A0A919V223_9ACTN|nr:Pycsar system effector family protein [Sphaerisporangium rufum]GII78463.1 hypothetical protein Sru01_34450 [Sphaerisporangium rufum]
MFRRSGRAPAEPAAARREAAALAHAVRLLAETREEVGRADAKAQVLLGVAGVGLGAVAGGLIAQSWSPFALADQVEWLWWAGLAAALASLGCLSGAVYPRRGRPGGGAASAIGYYGDALRFGSPQALAAALAAPAGSELHRACDQLLRVSHIVARKFRLIRWGFWLLVAGVVAGVGAVVLDRLAG